MKKLIIFIFAFLIFGLLGFFVIMDVTQKEGIFSNHWWWIGEVIFILICVVLWLIFWIIRRKKEQLQLIKPKEGEIRKDDIFEYEELLDKWSKDKRNKDPDMYKIETIHSFPSEEDPQMKIIQTKRGYNLNKRILLAVDQNTKKIIAKSEEDIEKFKEMLKPKLFTIAERTERDIMTGKEMKYRLTKPLEEAIKEQREKEEEKERIESMEKTKKEEK